MRICRLCHTFNYPVEQKEGQFYIAPFAFRLVHYPADFFPEVVFVGPRAPNGQFEDEAARAQLSNPPHITVQLLPVPENRLWRWVRQWPVLWQQIGAADLVCTTIPDEIGFFTALICRFRRKPLLVQVIGNWGEAVRF